MLSKRTLTSSVLVAALGLAAGAAFLNPSVASAEGEDGADDAKPCKATKFEFPQVAAACKSGGKKAAKALMNDLKKKAKEKGKDFKCTDCHTDTKDYANKPDAVKKLKDLGVL
jgi:hypothetical protein